MEHTHKLEYNIWSAKVSWCPICLKHFYTCPECDGTGVTIGTTQGCCGNANPDGSCCGCSIPEPIQEQCVRCSGTGYL